MKSIRAIPVLDSILLTSRIKKSLVIIAFSVLLLSIPGATIPTAQAQVPTLPERDYNDLMDYPNWPYMSSAVLTGHGMTANDAMVEAGVIIETLSGPSINAYQLFDPIGLPTNIFDDQFPDFIQFVYATPVSFFGTDVLADGDDPGFVQRDEVNIAINPTNPLNLVSASHRLDLLAGTFQCEFSSSFDGGATWGGHGVLIDPILPSPSFEGDPSLTFDAAGNVYYACDGFASGSNNIVVHKSTDGGITWFNPAASGAAVLDDGVDFHDKEWITADQNPFGTSPFANNLYLSWSEFTGAGPVPILFKSSTDGGVTWSSEITLSTSFSHQMSYPFVDPSNGDVYVMFIEFGTGVGGEARLMIVHSVDGGASFGAPVAVDDPMDDRFFEFIDESQGAAREPPQVQGCVTGEGDVLAVWRDFPSTGSTDSDIHYSNSFDGGLSWTPPVVVNVGISGDQFFPSISCQADQAHISWGDQRFDALPVDTGLFDIFYRSVTPGTPPVFGLELRVTDFTQDATLPGQFLGFEPIAGDYFDSVTSDTAFHPIWTDFRTPDIVVFGSRFVDAGIKIAAPVPTVSINDVSLAEGDAGLTPFTFTVTRSDNINAIDVDFAIADGTATLADSDFNAAAGTLSFTAGGPLTLTIPIQVNGDTNVEPDETFFVNLSNCAGCTFTDSQGQGTIQNDDVAPGPTVSINDVSLNEGNAGTTAFTFTVTRSDNTDAISVDFATADGTATLADSDYNAAGATLSFLAGGSLTQTITVQVVGDVTVESDETFFVDLSNCVGCTFTDNQGQGTIQNDDTGITLAPGDMIGSGGNSGVDPGSIFLVSQVDGSQTFIGDPTVNGGLSGLAFDNNNRLWGSNVIPGPTSNLLEINPSDGSLINDVGSIELASGQEVKIRDLGFDPISNQLFGTASNNNLVTIDRTTGVATPVGLLPNSFSHIGFAPGGTLWMVDRNNGGSLFTLDPTNANVLTQVVRSPDGELDALGVSPSGVIFVARTTFQGLGPEISTIDAAGNRVVVGSGLREVADLTFVPDVAVGGSDVSINTSALLLAGVQSISMWMIPVVIAGIGIGIFVIKKRN